MAENGSIAAPEPSRARKLSRISLRDQAVHALRTMIVNGAMAGGERINEAELAATLGISRGPLREAIQRVGAEGLIEFQRNRGAFVREIALEDIEDMYEARVIIESMAARCGHIPSPQSCSGLSR
jgi:DNA-binding GntR family transcriptional regulator